MSDTKDIIVAVTTFVAAEIERIDDVVDSAFAPTNDYTDTIGDIVAPIRAIASVHSLWKRWKLKGFLKQYAERVRESSHQEILVPKLEKYLSKPRNLEFISQTIDNAVAAKSIRCSCIMGFFAGDILANSFDSSYRDFLVINCLANLLDQDIDNFVALRELLSE